MTDVSTVAAAGAINASKIYGKDDSEVRALDDVTVILHSVNSPQSWDHPDQAKAH